MIRYLLVFFVSSLLLTSCATTEYMGKTYTPTTHVDVFFDASDISRSFETMGTAKTEGTEYLTFELIEQQLVKDAMSKGADAIIIEGMDTITVGSTSSTSGKSDGKSRYILTDEGKLRNIGGDGHYSSISTTTDIRDKVIRARLIKYN